MGYIYKITNIITGGIYVGQTRQTLDQRLNQHFRLSKSNRKLNNVFYQDILKYKKENFTIESVVYVQDDSKLNELETFYIRFFNSLRLKNNKNYNISVGGNYNSLRKNSELNLPLIKINNENWTIKVYEKKKEILKDYTIKELSRIYDVIEDGSNFAFGFYWKEMVIPKTYSKRQR